MPSYTTSSTVSALINSMEVNASNIGKASANGTAEERNFMKTLEMGPNVISTGIKLNRLLNVTKQGVPEHVDNDFAMMIGDGGFFTVTSTPAPDDETLIFTRAGYFYFDQDGYARNENGFYIRIAKYHETTDAQNFIKNNVEPRDLIPLNKNNLISPFKETENLNLNFSLPIPTAEEKNPKTEFIKQFSVFDNLGQEHNINLTFLRDTDNTKKWRIALSSDENISIKDNNNNLLFTANKDNLTNPLFDNSQPFEVEFNNAGQLIKVSSLQQEALIKTLEKTNDAGEVYYQATDDQYYTASTLPNGTQFKQAIDNFGTFLWTAEDGKGYATIEDAQAANTTFKYKTNPDGSISVAQSKNLDGKDLWVASDGNSYSSDAVLPNGVTFNKRTDDATNVLYVTTDNSTLTLMEILAQNKTVKQAQDTDGNPLWLGDNGNYYKDEASAFAVGANLTQATDRDGNLLWLADDGTYHKDQASATIAGTFLVQATDADGNPLCLGDDGNYYKNEASAVAASTTLTQATDTDGNLLWLADDGTYHKDQASAVAASTTLTQATDTNGNPLWLGTDGTYKTSTTPNPNDDPNLQKDGDNNAIKAHIKANIPAPVNAKAIAPEYAKAPLMENVKIPHQIALTEDIESTEWESTPIIDATDPLNIITGKTSLTFTWQDGYTSTTSFDFGEPLSIDHEYGLSAKHDAFSGSVEQDGNELGKFQSLDVSDYGEISILYDNGISNIYGKIPVAQFNNPNALQPVSGNAFMQTYESGPLRLTDGKIITGVVEKSSVDQIRNIMEANNTQKTIGFAMKAYAKQNEVEDMILKTL